MRATITRTEVFAFARSLGADPRNIREITIEPLAVTVTTYRTDEAGQRVAADDGEPVREVTTIALVGEDGGPDRVLMRHPLLDAEVEVPASAVGQHAIAGWEAVVPAPAVADESAQAENVSAGGEPPAQLTGSKPTPRVRRKKEEE
ncbi:hypothetical protein [Actinomadura harenae]|uniref:Uncharacterized protein n=1 Tax=Actinomadura harenae TaxID=2483351 RepID=A0A3M2LY22_9ACTN|nr:hypothetical protein [Actinomadura harenae]RMI39878.1 hypothetical protein EBO15_28335 [Actinomadura harenae]